MTRKLQEMWVAASAEKHKLGVLVVMLAVLGGLGVRALVSGGPRTAAASGGEQAGTTKNDEALAFLEIESERSGRFITAPTPARLERNLFALDPRFFPEPEQPEQVDKVPPREVSAGGESDDVPAEASGPTREELIREEALGFKLGSTVVGSNPIAVIERAGQSKGERMVVGVGDEFEGFRVVEIRSKVVVLEKETVRVTLRLALPQGSE